MQYEKDDHSAALDAEPLLLFLEAIWFGSSPGADA
jgi:hypothetical protein